MTNQNRSLRQKISAKATTDGAGVRINRVAGKHLVDTLDPFILLDEMKSEESSGYIGGFPEHPHRGFETVTYMLHGAMRHRDHMGNEGLLESGDVQWMTAGRGVIHSEMPEQQEGLLHGFQLWVNLPAKEKMKDPHYQEYKSSEFPIIDLPEGGKIKVIAGSVVAEQNRVEGLVSGVATSPLYLDITLSANEGVVIPAPESHTALVYVFDGATDELDSQQLGVYEQGVAIALNAGAQGARLLLVAAQPLREPVVQYGPFVMNTMEEVEQALSDYRDGNLTT